MASAVRGRTGIAPVNDLERLLVEASTNPVARPAFIRALLGGDVFVLASVDRPPVDGKAQPGSRMNVVTWSDADGPITPFYTSQEQLQRSLDAVPGTDPRFIQLPARDFLTIVRGARLVLNPHGDHGKMFLPDEVAALLDGREPGLETDVVQAAEQVLVGAPAHVPGRLLPVLRGFLATRPTIDRAWLGWMARPDRPPGYLLVVASDDDTAMAGFGSVQVGDVTDGSPLDVVIVPTDRRDHLLAAQEPFYRRP